MNLDPTLAITMPGPMEMFFIFVVVIVLFGAKRLPELARSLGKSAVEFKKARREFEKEIKDVGGDLSLEEDDSKEALPRVNSEHGSVTRPDRP